MINKIRLSMLNKSWDKRIKDATIKKANKKDCLNASFTERKIKSRFNPTNLTKNPTIAAVPTNAKNKET